MALPFLDVCIRGAGIVGRTLALLLAGERLRVGIVRAEAPPDGATSDVRAYALNAASRDLLQALRAWPDSNHATPVAGMQVVGDDGGQVNFKSREHGGEPLAWIVDVQALQARLDEAIGYQAMVQWLDGPTEATLTVVSEGKASATRAQYGVQFAVTPYPQQAIAGRLIGEKPHGGIARQWFSGNEILALLPMGGESPASPGNSVAMVWSVREERAAGLLAAPPAEFQAQVEAASHGAMGKLTLCSERAAWPLQLARPDRWVGPGWALAGDAAHTVHPLAGQGLNLGLADARELARVMRERETWRSPGDARLLRRYERARKPAVLAMGAATDGLQQLFARHSAPWASLRNWGMKGFDRSGPVKQWVVRRAAGLP